MLLASAQAAEAAPVFSYFGGPVTPSLTIYVVFWTSAVDATWKNNDPQFLTDTTSMPAFDLKRQYRDLTGASIAGGMTFAGSYTITPSVCATTPCTVTDAQVDSEP